MRIFWKSYKGTDEDKELARNDALSELPTGIFYDRNGESQYRAITGVRVEEGILEFQFTHDESLKSSWVNITSGDYSVILEQLAGVHMLVVEE